MLCCCTAQVFVASIIEYTPYITQRRYLAHSISIYRIHKAHFIHGSEELLFKITNRINSNASTLNSKSFIVFQNSPAFHSSANLVRWPARLFYICLNNCKMYIISIVEQFFKVFILKKKKKTLRFSFCLPAFV